MKPLAATLPATLLMAAWLTAPAAAAGTASAGGERWLAELETAQAHAADGDRLILIDLYADWCGWCKRLDREVFSTPAFLEFAADFVLLRVDTENPRGGALVAERYGIETLPTTLVLDQRGVKVGEVTGFAPAGDYQRKIQLEIARYRWLESRFGAMLEEPESPELLRGLAEDFHQRFDGERAAALYDRVLAEPELTSEERDWTRYRLVDALRLAGRFDSARSQLTRTRDAAGAHQDAQLLEYVDLMEAELAREAGDCAEAVVALKSFLLRHPDSRLRRQAHHTLQALETGAQECT